jgi:GH25 family lysozyme M1 (1,4-beta-N-acetylmuramidase)
MSQLEGVDVSHHEGNIDWPKAKAAGLAFAMIKATQGTTFVDPMAQANLLACRAAGIVTGMYHFYRHDADPAAQAAFFLHNIGSVQPGDLPPAVDVEEPADGAGPVNYSQAEVVQRVQVFVQAVRSVTGRAPMIYTYPAAWQSLTGNSSAFAATNPLWIASYGKTTPQLPGGWKDYMLWQYTDKGTVPGIGTVDRDRFNGSVLNLSATKLSALAAGGDAVLNQDGNIRSAAGLSAQTIRVFTDGTHVKVVSGPQPANGRAWWKVDDGKGTVGWCSSLVLNPA